MLNISLYESWNLKLESDSILIRNETVTHAVTLKFGKISDMLLLSNLPTIYVKENESKKKEYST